jgi:hypothetical protein
MTAFVGVDRFYNIHAFSQQMNKLFIELIDAAAPFGKMAITGVRRPSAGRFAFCGYGHGTSRIPAGPLHLTCVNMPGRHLTHHAGKREGAR